MTPKQCVKLTILKAMKEKPCKRERWKRSVNGKPRFLKETKGCGEKGSVREKEKAQKLHRREKRGFYFVWQYF